MLTLMLATALSLNATSPQPNFSANKDNVRKIYAAIDANDATKLGMLIADDYTFTSPITPQPLDKKAFIAFINGMNQSFSGLKHEILTIVEEGRIVFIYGMFKGKYANQMPNGPQATGQMTEAPFTTVMEFNDKGQIKSSKVTFDNYVFMTQLGAINPKAGMLTQITTEMYAALNKYDFVKFGSFIAENSVDYAPGEPVKGKKAIMEHLGAFFSGFPDFTVEVGNITVSGNKVYIPNTFKGTQTKPLFGMIPATGKMVTWTDVDILEFDDMGKCTAHWAQNPNEPLRQLGFGALANPNTSVVMAAYAAFAKADVAGILAQCTNDVLFDVTDGVFLPEGKMYKGATEVPEFFKYLASKVQFTKFEPYRFLADGDDVVVYINGEYKNIKTGKMSTANIVHQFKVVNGKVTWFKGTTDAPKDSMAAMSKK